MINIFDPDVFIVGGGAIETSKEFQQWFLGADSRGRCPMQREEQALIPIQHHAQWRYRERTRRRH